jgi:hypothetical protein
MKKLILVMIGVLIMSCEKDSINEQEELAPCSQVEAYVYDPNVPPTIGQPDYEGDLGEFFTTFIESRTHYVLYVTDTNGGEIKLTIFNENY